MMSPAEQLFFLFIALHLMQNPIGWCCGWLKIPELARRIFRRARHQMSRQRHFASSARGFFGFCFISGHRIFVTTPQHFDLSSYKKRGGAAKGKGIVLGNQWRGENEAAHTKLEETIDRRGEKSMKYSTLNSCTFQNKFVTLQPVRCSVRLRFS